MLERLFPKRLDNGYRGSWLALDIFVIAIALKALQGALSMLDTRDTAINADGIPLASFSLAAQQEVITMFALLGLWLLVLPLLSVVALIRYRSMIPLLYLALLGEQLAARLVVWLHTQAAAAGAATGQPVGFYVNLAILAVTALGFFLSLTERKGLREALAG